MNILLFALTQLDAIPTELSCNVNDSTLRADCSAILRYVFLVIIIMCALLDCSYFFNDMELSEYTQRNLCIKNISIKKNENVL